MLYTLLVADMPAANKKKVIHDEYSIPMKKSVLKIKPCKRNNRQNFDHTKNAVNKATLRSDPTQAAE